MDAITFRRTRMSRLAILLAAALLAPAAAAEEHITSGGLDRTYTLVDGARGNAPAPLVIVLHGGGGSGSSVMKSSGFGQLARDKGFIGVFPDGSGRVGTWNAAGCCGSALRDNVDDVGFIRDVIADVKSQHNVDPSRIYLVGMSNGAMLTHRAAIALSGEIAAAGTVVGAMFGGEPMPASPVPIVILNAADDDTVPVAGGMSPRRMVARAQTMPFQPAAYQASFWAKADGCAAPAVTEQNAGFTRQSWTGCAAGSEVVFYIVNGAGHGWLGGKHNDNPGSVDATAVIWDFLTRHHK